MSNPADNRSLGAARSQHHGQLLRLLWAHREISRANLARETGLSRSTVSSIVNDILSSGVVRETRAGTSNGGRRPIMLGFDDNARVVLGLDIGASHVGGVLTNLRGEVLARQSFPFFTREAPVETMQSVLQLAHELVGRDTDRLLGVGVALPSPIDTTTGRPLRFIMESWADVDVAGQLARSLHCPVRIGNDANLGALAELWWGEGRDGSDLVYVKVATGIGAGLIVGGRIVSGAHGVAGELGHLSVDPNGPPCRCGVNGCLNVMVGTEALLQRAEARRPHHPTSELPIRGISLPALIEAARNRDSLALEIVSFAGQQLGQGLANMMNVLDPATIVLGGRLTKVGEPLIEPIRETIRKRTLVNPSGSERVVCSQIDEQNVALGAATLILRSALETLELPLSTSLETL